MSRRRPADLARRLYRPAGVRGGQFPAGGGVSYVEPPAEWRGTTVQVCGLWPWIVGSGVPRVGVPLGRQLGSGATVCCDPLSWFTRARIVTNPSAFIMGLNGKGKSTVVRRWMTGLSAYGYIPLAFGDLKPDYAELIDCLGGSVVRLGRGHGRLNVVDPGASAAAAQRLVGRARDALLADAHGRRLNMICALVELNRQRVLSDVEPMILDVALRVLDDRLEPGWATLVDLAKVLDEGPEQLRMAALDRGNDTKYRAVIDPIQTSITALCQGSLGETFAAHTTVKLDISRPLCVDISAIGETDRKLQAAALLACWSEGFAAIEAAGALADAEVAPQQYWLICIDELWRVLQAGHGMVHRVNALTRVNRTLGVGQVFITHTLSDTTALARTEDREMARGFAERAGLMVIGGLPKREFPMLDEVVELSGAERRLLEDWSAPATVDPDTGRRGDVPGLGKFLIKIGGRPGIAVNVDLTPSELELSDTNRRWAEVMAP